MSNSENFSVQAFLNYLAFQKRYSKNTLISYENDLSAFFAFVLKEYQLQRPGDISAALIRTWLANLKDDKVASRTVNRKISSLKSYFKFLLRTNEISVSPMAAISALKISRKLPAFIAQEDLKTLLGHDFFDDGFEGSTQRLIFEIFYHTGIRRNELIHLKEGDVDRYAGALKVLGKGNKERLIPVSNGLLEMISTYIAEKRKLFGNEAENFLLINKKGKKLDPKGVYNVVKKFLSKVSTNQKKSPHTLRHSFATHLTNNGAEINAVKELLGHSSLASTQIYTHNSIDKLKEIYKQAHPKGE